MDVQGLAAIVTGGGSGLGAATAKLLASKGAKVALLDVNQEGMDAVAKEIGGLAIKCDVTDDDAVKAAVDQANAAHGVARIVVNCAGVATGERIVGREAPYDIGRFRKTVEINLMGTFSVMNYAANAMAKEEPVTDDGERGVIINTASVAAFDGQVGQAAYSSSKAAVAGMTLPAARELSKFGIRVNTVAPGLMETPMMSGMPPQVYESLVATTLFPKRLGKPEEYAELALHICENSMLNGETIRLDGSVRLAPK
ncbi:MAG: SDR family oxidoreductase [Alphaproteobacteria bacterium]|nr:SDR family oxidoreductase [Alphaproteobacteria bacterium SS10]